MQDQVILRTAPRLSTLPGGQLRAIWDGEGPGGVAQFYPKGEGVVLDFIRVNRGNPFNGARLLVDALRAAGIHQPRFVESSPIINPTLSNLLQSGVASDLAQVQRFWHIQSLAFARAIGASLTCSEVVKNPRGNWIARGYLSY